MPNNNNINNKDLVVFALIVWLYTIIAYTHISLNALHHQLVSSMSSPNHNSCGTHASENEFNDQTTVPWPSSTLAFACIVQPATTHQIVSQIIICAKPQQQQSFLHWHYLLQYRILIINFHHIWIRTCFARYFFKNKKNIFFVPRMHNNT